MRVVKTPGVSFSRNTQNEQGTRFEIRTTAELHKEAGQLAVDHPTHGIPEFLLPASLFTSGYLLVVLQEWRLARKCKRTVVWQLHSFASGNPVSLLSNHLGCDQGSTPPCFRLHNAQDRVIRSGTIASHSSPGQII